MLLIPGIHIPLPVAAIPTGIPATSIGGGGLTNTELGYLATITSDIQTQLAAKQNLHANLTGLAAITPTKGNIPVGNGTTFVSAPTVGADGTQITATASEATGVSWGAAS